jgi:hypothetical protein
MPLPIQAPGVSRGIGSTEQDRLRSGLACGPGGFPVGRRVGEKTLGRQYAYRVGHRSTPAMPVMHGYQTGFFTTSAASSIVAEWMSTIASRSWQ